ncbi:MAG: hypothetical protein A3E78_10745 [Alphaproteobacteria bacterium RIFCSPHIGHO2_12_FULL_63_12]|nr:MAG: hypothetical protein A3E78_10745 [Alphaproteobacteria bacterium RIFCSPHIGHO2_12_FULL_63_12]
MAYGSKRGIKTPGEYGFMDIAGLGLAGAAGIVAALVTDYQQKGEASSLYTINQWAAALGEMLGFGAVPLWMVSLALIATGAMSIFYFQPITRQGAFAQGFGLLAVIMTAVPADLAGGIQPTGPTLPDLQPVSLTREAALDGIVLASLPAEEARVIEVQDNQAARYVVEINIEFPDGVPSNIDELIRRGACRGRLHNSDTNETFNLFRSAGGNVIIRGDSLVVRAGVPARSTEATLWVRVEVEGYAIEEQSAKANLDSALNWTVNMRKSSTPLFIQRLSKSYWF